MFPHFILDHDFDIWPADNISLIPEIRVLSSQALLRLPLALRNIVK